MSKMNRRVIARTEYCMGCGLCKLGCQVSHSSYPLNIITAMKKSVQKPIPRMSVEVSSSYAYATVRCRHCEEPECYNVCIAGAISKDPDTGIVSFNQDKCVGCWSCVLACPYGAVQGPSTGDRCAYKCDLCPGLERPACVAMCPNEALVVEESPA